MTFLDFIYTESMTFWKSVPVQCLVALWTCTCFFRFTRSFERRNRYTAIYALLTVIFMMFLCTQYYEVARHCFMTWMILFLCFYASHRIPVSNAAVVSISYVAITEFAATAIKENFIMEYATGDILYLNIILFILWAICIALVSKLTQRFIRTYQSIPLKPWHVAVLFMPTMLYIFLRNTKFLLFTTGTGSNNVLIRLQLMEITLCLITLFLSYTVVSLISSGLELNEHLRHELLLQKQSEQYQIKAQVIETVNRKYHDLKHILSAVKDPQVLEAMQKEIAPFEIIQRTGNTTLDILVSEKIRICTDKGIQLHCFIDGAHLSFIRDVDLCSLYGNAIDNAIEACEKALSIDNEIYIKTERKDDFILMTFQNPYMTVNMENGVLKTIKENREDHGYGIASMKETVQRYRGSLSYTAENHIFILTVLIPVPQA